MEPATQPPQLPKSSAETTEERKTVCIMSHIHIINNNIMRLKMKHVSRKDPCSFMHVMHLPCICPFFYTSSSHSASPTPTSSRLRLGSMSNLRPRYP